MSQAIVSGLSFATLLTLVCTPALLALPHQLHALIDRVRHRLERRGKIAPA